MDHDVPAGAAQTFSAFVSDETVLRKISVVPSDVVLVKGICEASEGLCAMFAEHGGDLVLAAPLSRARDLDELVADLVVEFDAVVEA